MKYQSDSERSYLPASGTESGIADSCHGSCPKLKTNSAKSLSSLAWDMITIVIGRPLNVGEFVLARGPVPRNAAMAQTVGSVPEVREGGSLLLGPGSVSVPGCHGFCPWA